MKKTISKLSRKELIKRITDCYTEAMNECDIDRFTKLFAYCTSVDHMGFNVFKYFIDLIMEDTSKHMPIMVALVPFNENASGGMLDKPFEDDSVRIIKNNRVIEKSMQLVEDLMYVESYDDISEKIVSDSIRNAINKLLVTYEEDMLEFYYPSSINTGYLSLLVSINKDLVKNTTYESRQLVLKGILDHEPSIITDVTSKDFENIFNESDFETPFMAEDMMVCALDFIPTGQVELNTGLYDTPYSYVNLAFRNSVMSISNVLKQSYEKFQRYEFDLRDEDAYITEKILQLDGFDSFLFNAEKQIIERLCQRSVRESLFILFNSMGKTNSTFYTVYQNMIYMNPTLVPYYRGDVNERKYFIEL